MLNSTSKITMGIILVILLSLFSSTALAADEIAASRSISKDIVKPGDVFIVTVTLKTNKELVTVGLKEIVPNGWTVTEKNSGSFTYSPSNTEWIWTNIMSNVASGTSASIAYNIKVPASATDGTYSVNGKILGKNTPLNGGSDIQINVLGENRITVKKNDVVPILSPIGSKSVKEGKLLSFTLSTKNLGGNKVTYSASGLPTGAKLNPTTGKFTWTPGYSAEGKYTVKFIATANGQSDYETITITVTNVNRPPVLTKIGAKVVKEGKSLSFTLSAKDPDDDKIKYSATGIPKGAKLDATTGKFTWTLGYAASGTYTVKFIATANGQTDSETIKIMVKNVK